MTQVDRFPVKELMGRYNIGRTALYDRFKHANIKPEKFRTRSFVSGEQLAELDRLNDYLAAGGSFEDFIPKYRYAEASYGEQEEEQATAIAPNSEVDIQLPVPSANLGVLVQAVSEGMSRAIAASQTQPNTPLWYMKELKQAADEGWLLTTKEIRELIGVKPVTSKGEKVYKRGCWLFQKAGKIGSQTAWKVSKSMNNEQ